MSKQIILITGGARSGKSKYAEDRVLKMGRRRLYLATAEAKDEEMVQRIAAHKKRRGDSWTTIEEPVEMAEALLAHRGNADGSGIVPDNPLARQFRDLCGRMNQRVAQVADEVVLMVAGLPLIIKKDSACF